MDYLLGLSHNKKCADCGNRSPAWCAWTFGLFICYTCSGQHRRLGPQVSKVKSTTMDVWAPDDLRRMYVGGNKLAYKIPDNADVLMKYRDCGDFVAELDRLCRESEKAEPGDSFMNLNRTLKNSGFGSAVIKKKGVPKFSDKLKAEVDAGVSPAKEAVTVAPTPADACVERKVNRDPISETEQKILARSKKAPVNLSRTIDAFRSPFSFKPDVSEEEDSD